MEVSNEHFNVASNKDRSSSESYIPTGGADVKKPSNSNKQFQPQNRFQRIGKRVAAMKKCVKLMSELELFKESDDFISIAVFSATGLPKVDFIGSCDPYIKILVGDQTLQTVFKPDTVEPKWYQLFCVEVDKSSVKSIVFEVYDHDAMNRFKYIGKFEVQMKQADGRLLECPIYGGKNPNTVDKTVTKGSVQVQIGHVQVLSKSFQQGMVLKKSYIDELENFDEHKHVLSTLGNFLFQPEVPVTLQQGDDVMADFMGTEHRSGKVEKVNADGSYDILFDHGAKVVKLDGQRVEKHQKELKILEALDTYFTIAVLRATGLPRVDKVGSCDPYVKIIGGERPEQTEFISKTLDPMWYQLFCIHVDESKNDRLTFEIWDKNTTKDDLYIGKSSVLLNSVDGNIMNLPFYDDDEMWRGWIQLRVAKAYVKDHSLGQGTKMETQELREALEREMEIIHGGMEAISKRDSELMGETKKDTETQEDVVLEEQSQTIVSQAILSIQSATRSWISRKTRESSQVTEGRQQSKAILSIQCATRSWMARKSRRAMQKKRKRKQQKGNNPFVMSVLVVAVLLVLCMLFLPLAQLSHTEHAVQELLPVTSDIRSEKKGIGQSLKTIFQKRG